METNDSKLYDKYNTALKPSYIKDNALVETLECISAETCAQIDLYINYSMHHKLNQVLLSAYTEINFIHAQTFAGFSPIVIYAHNNVLTSVNAEHTTQQKKHLT